MLVESPMVFGSSWLYIHVWYPIIYVHKMFISYHNVSTNLNKTSIGQIRRVDDKIAIIPLAVCQNPQISHLNSRRIPFFPSIPNYLFPLLRVVFRNPMSHQNRVDFVGLNPHGRVKLWIYRLGEPPSIPSGYVKIAIENGPFNSWFSHWKWWCSIVM